MASQATDIWQIGKWRVEPALGRVASESGEDFLRPREMDLLVYLAEQQGQIVTADDIVSDVWSGVEVTNDSLYFSISQLRKRLDEPDAEYSVIETIPKRGYRLTVPAERLSDVDATATISDGDSSKLETAVAARSRSSIRGFLPGAIAVVVAVLAVSWFRVEAPELPQSTLTSPANSIAVMPFIDLSPDTDYTYFSDGITDEILNRLARIQGLLVAARTSSFAFKESASSVTEIGTELGVETILEGSVRKEGDRVRISVQLINTDSGFQLWSETYERELRDIFAIQDEISHEIASALRLALVRDTGIDNRVSVVSAPDPQVVDEYLLGLELARNLSFDSIRQAILHFENVLRIDPVFTQATLQLADAKLGLLNTGASYDLTLIDEAERLAGKALERDPASGSAYRILSMVSRWRGNWQQSQEQLSKAIELSPSDSIAMVNQGELFMIRGELKSAGEAFDRALRIDPFGFSPLMKNASLKIRVGDIAEAISVIERAIFLHPTNPNGPWVLGKIKVGEYGDLAGGLDDFLRSAALDLHDYEIAAYVAMTYLSLGMYDEAEPWIRRAKADGPDTATTQAIEATYLQLTGNHVEATTVSTRAIENRDYRLHFHSILSNNLVVIVVRNLLEDRRAGYAIELLENAMPDPKNTFGMQRNAEVEGSLATLNKISGSWLVALAYSRYENGDTVKALEMVKDIDTRNANEVPGGHPSFRNQDYLLQARLLAMQGDDDAAMGLLELAVEQNLIFGWQIQVAGDYAFRHLQLNPRFTSIVEQIENRVERQRNIVLARESSATSALVD